LLQKNYGERSLKGEKGGGRIESKNSQEGWGNDTEAKKRKPGNLLVLGENLRKWVVEKEKMGPRKGLRSPVRGGGKRKAGSAKKKKL